MVDEKGRICTVCDVYKLWEEFGIEKYVKSGHRSNCKVCEANKKAEYYQKNKDDIKKQHAEYYLKLKEAYGGEI